MRSCSIIFCFLLGISFTAIGQSDGNYDYSREFIWGINKNTNGGLIGGFVFKWANALSENQFKTMGFELMNVKHPSETRWSLNGKPFLYPKQNYLYSIRGLYGRDFILFKKAAQQGVQILYSIAGGPTIGVVAPYYIVTADGRAEQYDPNKHTSPANIQGTGHLFQGLGESSIKFGLNAKASLSFELGAFKSNVTGFEIGAQIEAFTEEIVIVPTQPNNAVFTSAFLTFFYGHRK